mgnify:CR=1 FL=1
METLNFLMQGFDVATRPVNLLVALFGAFVGTVVGLLPGLGPINGVAILLPLAFALGLPPETALILLAAIDAPYQKWNWLRKLKMTRQELREEMKRQGHCRWDGRLSLCRRRHERG